MRWPWGQRQQPAASKANKGQQMREALSPYDAGLTGDPGKSWDTFLREEFGTGPADEPAATVPAPGRRQRPASTACCTLSLCRSPATAATAAMTIEKPADKPRKEDAMARAQTPGRVPSPVTIRQSETRPGHCVATVRDEQVELPANACHCGMAACRSGWPEDAPLIYPDADMEAG